MESLRLEGESEQALLVSANGRKRANLEPILAIKSTSRNSTLKRLEDTSSTVLLQRAFTGTTSIYSRYALNTEQLKIS